MNRSELFYRIDTAKYFLNTTGVPLFYSVDLTKRSWCLKTNSDALMPVRLFTGTDRYVMRDCVLGPYVSLPQSEEMRTLTSELDVYYSSARDSLVRVVRAFADWDVLRAAAMNPELQLNLNTVPVVSGIGGALLSAFHDTSEAKSVVDCSPIVQGSEAVQLVGADRFESRMVHRDGPVAGRFHDFNIYSRVMDSGYCDTAAASSTVLDDIFGGVGPDQTSALNESFRRARTGEPLSVPVPVAGNSENMEVDQTPAPASCPINPPPLPLAGNSTGMPAENEYLENPLSFASGLLTEMEAS